MNANFNYYPAQLYKGSRWYIGYYVRHPHTGAMVRKIIKFNRIKNLREREKEGRNLVKLLNEKLASGWNPFIEQESPRSFTYLHEALGRYFQQIHKMAADNTIRPDTLRSYESNYRLFRLWVPDFEKKFCIWFTRDQLSAYLDHIYYDRNRSPRTRNNHLAFWKTVGNWLVMQKYVKVNPADGIVRVRNGTKKRMVIERSTLDYIFDHLQHQYPEYYTLCLTIYYTFIRRKELSMLPVSSVNFKEKTIIIPGTISKNRKTEVVTMPPKLVKQLYKHVGSAAAVNYLFSENNYKPGAKQIAPKKISDTWAKLRTHLQFDANYQFYSLKDTGITHMLEAGITPIAVRDQARHHSLSQTNEYTPTTMLKANPILSRYA